MPRIKLEQQPSYEFKYTVMLGPGDINYGGHLGNDSLVSLMGTARVMMFRSMGLSEGDLGDGRTGIIMADLVVNFKSEAFMFDELSIDTHIGEVRRTGFRLFHRVTRGNDIIALSETGLTCFDYTAKKVSPLPERFLKALSAFQG